MNGLSAQDPDVRDKAGRLFDEQFRAAGWTDEDLASFNGHCIREGVIATAAGGEAAAMRQIIGAHTMSLPHFDPATGQVTDPLLDRCMAVIQVARGRS